MATMKDLDLKTERKKRKISQQEIAEKLGVDQKTYSNYENGKTEPTIKTIIKLTEIFNCTLDEIFNVKEKDNTFPEKEKLLKTINSLNEIECHKLNVFAQGLIMNRNFEQKERTLNIIKNIEEDK